MLFGFFLDGGGLSGSSSLVLKPSSSLLLFSLCSLFLSLFLMSLFCLLFSSTKSSDEVVTGLLLQVFRCLHGRMLILTEECHFLCGGMLIIAEELPCQVPLAEPDCATILTFEFLARGVLLANPQMVSEVTALGRHVVTVRAVGGACTNVLNCSIYIARMYII